MSEDRAEAGTEVAILGPVTALTVFGTEGGVDAILAKIRAQARSIETDISTPAGRQAVASLAYKIARSKTALDSMGKELGDANYRAWKAITAERTRIETELDALRDEIRKPLTEWENAEKARVAAHEAALDAIIEAPGFYEAANTPEDLRRRLVHLAAYPPRDWQEFAKRAASALEGEIAKTKIALAAAEKREADCAEALRLAREKAERERAEREALIAETARREAEEKARLAAEAEARRVAAETAAKERAAAEAAQREREAIEAQARADAEAAERARLAEKQARREAERRAAKAEEDRIAAAKAAEAERARIERERAEANRRADEAEAARLAATAKARADMEKAAADAEVARKTAAEDAAAAERQRIAAAQAKDAAEAAAREANRRHRGQINREARDALVREGLSAAAANTAVTAIARGAVPHVRIAY